MKNGKPVLLALCDSPSMTTGFANVSRNVLKVFDDLNFDINVLALNWDGHCPDHEEYPYRFWNPAPKSLTGTTADVFGHTLFPALVDRLDPDIVFILSDLPGFTQRYTTCKTLKDRKVIGFVSFESEIFPRWWAAGAHLADRLVTFSHWQRDILISHGAEPERCITIPHGYEEDYFDPLWRDLDERGDLRESLGLPRDAFIAFRCDRNEYRKQWPILVEGFGKFLAATGADDAYLYLHTSHDDYYGWDFDDLVDVWARDYKDLGKIMVTQGYESAWLATHRKNLNLLYNIADVYVSTTGGEAWGLTMHEAQAAGLPVLAPANTACPEVVQSGWLMKDLQRVNQIGSIEYAPPTAEDTAAWLSVIYNYTKKEGRPEWMAARKRGLDWAMKMTWEDVLRPLPKLIEGLLDEEKRVYEEEEEEELAVVAN